MRPFRSWDVPDEFWRLWWRSRQLRELILRVDVEPAAKGPASRRSAPEFQRQVMDEMECYRRYPMTGPVALARVSDDHGFLGAGLVAGSVSFPR